MRTVLRAVLLPAPLLLACAAAPTGAKAPPAKDDRAAAITLGETAVGSVAGCSVAVGNVGSDEFTGDDGKRRRAPRASLTIFDCPGGAKEAEVRVAAGQRVQIGGRAFVVSTVKETADSSGSVQLVPAPR